MAQLLEACSLCNLTQTPYSLQGFLWSQSVHVRRMVQKISLSTTKGSSKMSKVLRDIRWCKLFNFRSNMAAWVSFANSCIIALLNQILTTWKHPLHLLMDVTTFLNNTRVRTQDLAFAEATTWAMPFSSFWFSYFLDRISGFTLLIYLPNLLHCWYYSHASPYSAFF
jgi:hypothetical protein